MDSEVAWLEWKLIEELEFDTYTSISNVIKSSVIQILLILIMAMRCSIPKPSPRVVLAYAKANYDADLSIQKRLIIHRRNPIFK